MDPRRKFGNKGENIAAIYLIKKGYKIIKAPWSALPYGEIDIVAEHKGVLIFIEVKTRQSNDFGFPEEAVDWRKRKKISKLIELYIQNNKLFNAHYRFDVIAIEMAGDKSEIRHIEAVGID